MMTNLHEYMAHEDEDLVLKCLKYFPLLHSEGGKWTACDSGWEGGRVESPRRLQKQCEHLFAVVVQK
jgi:hypothetical protein